MLASSGSGDPHHRTSADQDGAHTQPLGAQSDHGDGGGGSRPPSAHHQRGPHRLPDVRHPGQHGPQDRLLREQVESREMPELKHSVKYVWKTREDKRSVMLKLIKVRLTHCLLFRKTF